MAQTREPHLLLLADDVCPVSLDDIAPDMASGRRRLLSVGEKMLGDLSFAGAPLHKIAYAAGLAKKNAVQYHFGGIEGLADAIFAVRQAYIGQRRRELLDRAAARDLLDSVTALLEALYLPMAEQVDAEGRNSYVRFFMQYFVRPGYHAHLDRRMTPQGGPSQEIYQRLSGILGMEYEAVASHIYLLGFPVYAALLERDGQERDARHDIAHTISRAVRLIEPSVLGPRRD